MIDFITYDEQNPKIWSEFKRIAFEAKMHKKFKHFSANGIFEIIRWETATSGNDGFKVNNNYRADYARKMMRIHKDFVGFFRLREIKAPRKQGLLPRIGIMD